ncbi:hypothetical protein ACF0H5_010403 [Mactra antiquata]
MRLRPSEIRYSQCSINNTFTGGDLIGEVLDDLCVGNLQKRSFPLIEVTKINRNWFTSDNRRLWVFRKLEELGRCGRIPVKVVNGIPPHKMSTKNNGIDVKVRGYPGGTWIRKLERPVSSSSSSAYESDDDELCQCFQKYGI